MGQIQLLDEVHAERLQQARHLFFDQGDLPEGLVDPLIVRSWERCRRFGIGETSMTPTTNAYSLMTTANFSLLERKRSSTSDKVKASGIVSTLRMVDSFS